MAENFSVERRRLMRFLGARVVLTPAHLRGSGMMAKTVELAEKHGWFLCRQFENEANADMHSRTTAPEIFVMVAFCKPIATEARATVNSGGDFFLAVMTRPVTWAPLGITVFPSTLMDEERMAANVSPE